MLRKKDRPSLTARKFLIRYQLCYKTKLVQLIQLYKNTHKAIDKKHLQNIRLHVTVMLLSNYCSYSDLIFLESDKIAQAYRVQKQISKYAHMLLE